MTKSENKSIPRIVFLRVIGLVLFLFFLYIANFLPFFTDNPLNYRVIQFLNENTGLIILMSIIFLFGELFNALIFPLNLPAPLFNASGSVLLVAFIFRIFALVDILLNEKIFQVFNKISFLMYPFVFIIVMLGGYMTILTKLSKTDQPQEKEIEFKQRKVEEQSEKTGTRITWEDVGNEFKQAIYDLLRLIRQSINKKINQKEKMN